MTSNREEYLKIIYSQGGLKKRVSNKTIAENLNVSATSVSEMLNKLSAEKLIDYKAYNGSILTELGFNSCIKVLRSHRLWEVFLINHLGYTFREAHEEAHVLEHLSSKNLLDRLDTFLGFPKVCPHGSIIPREGQTEFDTSVTTTLSQLKAGDIACIAKITEEGDLLDYVSRVGLEVGQNIELTSKEDYEGAISFIQNEKHISVSYKAATQIYVNLI